MQHLVQSKTSGRTPRARSHSLRGFEITHCACIRSHWSSFWTRRSIEVIDQKRSTGVDWGELANSQQGNHDDRSQSAKSGSLASNWWSKSPKVENDFESAWIGLKIRERTAQNKVDWCQRSPIVTSHKRARETCLSHSLGKQMSFHVINGSDRENGIISFFSGRLTEVSKKYILTPRNM
jgi:hypothetical protein